MYIIYIIKKFGILRAKFIQRMPQKNNKADHVCMVCLDVSRLKIRYGDDGV